MSEENKGIGILVTCNNCKDNFRIDTTNVAKKKYMYKEESLWITYYDCAVCGERYFAQIDDAKSNNMLNELTKNLAIFARYRRMNKKVNKKQSAKFERLRLDLAKSRNRLMCLYNGVTVRDADGSSVTLHFGA